MKRFLPHIGIALGLAIAIYALFFAETSEELIRAQLDVLENAAAVNEQENPVLRAARVKEAFAGLMVEEIHFEIPELVDEKTGRAELSRLATIAPRLYQSARIDLGSLKITVDKRETSAVAQGEALLTGVRRTGEPEHDTRTVSLRFNKVEDDWLIVSISVSLKQSPGS